jgi:hypothetical protein
MTKVVWIKGDTSICGVFKEILRFLKKIASVASFAHVLPPGCLVGEAVEGYWPCLRRRTPSSVPC